jgi:cell division protein FtsA
MTLEQRQTSRGPSRLWPFQARDDIVTVIDMGAQKIACAIIALASPRFGFDAGARSIRVLGSSTVRSSGLSGGRIVNLNATEASIRRAVGLAEAQAGLNVEDVLVTGQFHGLAADVFEAKLGEDAILAKEDIQAISLAAAQHCSAAQRELLHLFMTRGQAAIGGADRAIDAPDETDVIAISMPLRGVRQMTACVAKSLLTVRGYIAGPIATALAVTSAAERSSGILAIDMGAQSTGFILFLNGAPVFAECIAAGGQQISDEIANAFGLRKFEAERLKIRFGSVYDSLQADIDLPFQNGKNGEPISKFTLNHVIRLKASALLQAVNDRLKGAGYSIPSGGAVLAGGGSLLPGIRELTSHLFASEVRTAQPVNLNGLNAGTALSALVGGCLYASRHQSVGEIPYAPGLASQDSSYASRISQWLRTSFL